jgi:hypothetical protein
MVEPRVRLFNVIPATEDLSTFIAGASPKVEGAKAGSVDIGLGGESGAPEAVRAS